MQNISSVFGKSGDKSAYFFFCLRVRFFVFDTDTPCPYGGRGACVDVSRKDGDEERQKCMKCKKIQTDFVRANIKFINSMKKTMRSRIRSAE